MRIQVAVAEPQEDGCLRLTSATQSLDAVQQAVAGVLGLPFNKVAVGAQFAVYLLLQRGKS
jgi:xanthine dehydrogenase molybdopterin-binding subunit B